MSITSHNLRVSIVTNTMRQDRFSHASSIYEILTVRSRSYSATPGFSNDEARENRVGKLHSIAGAERVWYVVPAHTPHVRNMQLPLERINQRLTK